MKTPQAVVTFVERYPLIGPMFWAVSAQYFVTMLVVALAWPTGYSIANNTISDLGNTACGVYDGRYVCSPLHAWMNASFIVLGLTMVSGSLLIYQEFRRNTGSAAGFGAMALAGLGTVAVGIFAENTVSSLHELGALLPFVIGNMGMIVLGLSLDMSKRLKIYTVVSGAVALASFLLFATHNYAGLGRGGMERLTTYPQTLWLIVFGIYVSRPHIRAMLHRYIRQN